MPTVDIDGVGQVDFPDTMSQDQIKQAIERDILPNFNKQQQEAPTAPVAPKADPGIQNTDILKAVAQSVQQPPQVMPQGALMKGFNFQQFHPQSPNDTIRNTSYVADQANKGLASTLGLPVDAVAGGINGVSMLLGHGKVIDNPVGGSQWMEGMMDKLGMLKHQEADNPLIQATGRVANFAGASAIPFLGNAAKAGKITTGMLADEAAANTVGGLSSYAASQMLPDSVLAQIAAGAFYPAAKGVGSMAVRGALRGGSTGKQQMQNIIDAYKTAGTTPNAAQAGNGFSKLIGSYLSAAPGSVGTMSKNIEGQNAAIASHLDDTINNVSNVSEPAVAGRSIQSGIQDWVDGKFKPTADALVQKFKSYFTPNDVAQPTSTANLLTTMTTPNPGAPNLSSHLQNNGIKSLSQQFFTDLNSNNGNLPVQTLTDLKTQIGEKLANTHLLDDVTKGQYKRIYASLSDDIRTAASAKSPDALAAFNRQNAYYSAGMDRIDSFLQSTVNKDAPERAYTAALSDAQHGATKLYALRRSMSPDQWNDVAAVTARKLGMAPPGSQGVNGDAFSMDSFLTNWNKLNPKAKQALFGGVGDGSLMDNLDAVAQAADQAKQAARWGANPSGTAQKSALVGSISGMAGALGSGNPLIAGGLLAGMGLNHITAKMITNPDFVNWLAKSTTLKPGELVGHMARLNAAATDMNDPELKGDVQSYLAANKPSAQDELDAAMKEAYNADDPLSVAPNTNTTQVASAPAPTVVAPKYAELKPHLAEAAQQTNVDERYLTAIANNEALKRNGKYLTNPSSGAVGVMQIKPDTARDYKFTSQQLNDPRLNVLAGSAHYAHMLQLFNDPAKAAAAYNMGEGAFQRILNVAQKTGKKWETFLPKETRNYVSKFKQQIGQ